MRLYKILSWLIITLSAGLLIYLLALPYNACIVLISKISGYGKIDRLGSLLTPDKFETLKFTPVIGVILGILMLLFARRITYTLTLIWHSCVKGYEYLGQNFRSFSRTERLIFWLVVLINVLVKGYYMLNFAVTYDEAWTYLNFTDRSLISSMTYYAAPNNHILNSIFTNISNHLPLAATLRLRLPAFISGILFLMVFYVFSRRWFSQKLTILLLLILSFLTPQLFYSFAARGYILVMLFSAVCYFAAIRLMETRGSETRHLFYFAVCSILGFYTMPSFLYPYITLNIFLFGYAIVNKRMPLLRKQILWGIVTIIGVLILYTPVFAISGIGSIISNSYVVPISRAGVISGLFAHLLAVYKYLFTYQYALYIVYPVVILACFITQYKPIAYLNLWILVFMPFIPILHSVIPFERTWVYLTVPIIVSVGLILQRFMPSSAPSFAYYALGIVIASFTLLTSNEALIGIEDYAIAAEDAVQFAWRREIRSIYVKEPLMDTYLLYKYKTNARTLDCIIFEKDFLDRQKDIEYIIVRRGWQTPVKVDEPVFSNGYFDIYRNPSYINGSKP
ncbi:MAG: hypothetical protein EOP51_02705 [Sphingobacteriales bacterium]|nr:MAG: hypothetical protein EOP51_02705 [Sphingobacteriales bacterium]